MRTPLSAELFKSESELPSKKPLTAKKTLRNRQPLWASSPRISVDTDAGNGEGNVDVIIVGAGISGALTAHALARMEMKIMVVDRRRPVRGSSLASTAMIQHEIDVPLHKLASSVGIEKAQRIWQRSAKAVDELATLLEDARIRCDFERRRTLYLAGDTYGRRALNSEVDARRNAGIESTLITGRDLRARYGIARTAAIDSGISASSNPGQMTAGLLAHVRNAGVEIVADTEIVDFRSIGEHVVVSIDNGKLLTARHLVFCTGYEFLRSMENKSHSVISTWAIASRPNVKRPEWLDRYLVWEGSEPYLYFRSTPDGRVIIGGEDEDTPHAFEDDHKATRKAKRLAEKFANLTGIEIGKPEFIWSAAFGTTPNGLPMIGAVPGHRNVYAAMGYGGNGITYSQIAASIIAGEICGHRDPDAGLFPFQ